MQGLVSCKKCGYALSRTSTRTSVRKIHYYRCLGSDGWRHLGGSVCDSRPIRQDLLDHIVWQEVMRLIEDPELITAELDRRLDAARTAEPTKKRQEAVERDLTRLSKSLERLLTAYQEDLLSLDELRSRMPELRAREQALKAELQTILDQAVDRMAVLRLAETLTAFLQRLRESAETLDISDRQKIVRLLVKEVLVDDETITIRHSIPAHPAMPSNGSDPLPSNGKLPTPDQSYLLRSGSKRTTLRGPLVPGRDQSSISPALRNARMSLSTRLSDTLRRRAPSGCRDRCCRRKHLQTARHQDLPTSVTITRAGHAFEGRALVAYSRLKRRGTPLLLVELPDGSRTHMPVAWTDLGAANGVVADLPARPTDLGRLTDFLNLRILVDAFLKRAGESPPDDKEERHATTIEADLSRRRKRPAARPACLGKAGRRSTSEGVAPARPDDRSHADGQGGGS